MMAAAVTTAYAQEKKPLVSPIKFSGYIISRYTASFQEDNESNGFSIRLIRMTATGRVFNDFEWKIQGQLNGNGSTVNTSPRIVDCSLEWTKYKAFKVKFGQFKLPFTIENPEHPIDIGFLGGGTVIQKLSGFGDRTGQYNGNGRDIGIQVQGDLLPNAEGRCLFHYQAGIFNGQGINTGDANQQKDYVGGFWVAPIAGLRIGAFGWTGNYSQKGATVKKNRYAFSAEYDHNDWVARTEYVHGQGEAFKNSETAEINEAIGDKADGWYALLSVPVIKNKCHIRGRYDVYRQSGEWNDAQNVYEIEANYMFTKNLTFALEYALTDKRNLDKDYSTIEARASVRF